ncbi:MAG TPA: DUF2461 domain-containing protein [Bacteriovoracaceae bacterium]|nr:DUF2461 domain-containing protein [Bacteriovoracaceae bacterium]
MKTVLTFLKKIKKNNNTPWMHAHKDEYLEAKKEIEFLAQELIARIGSWDPKLPYLEPKHCMFRFNRDIRFSDDKRPYKENFGVFIAYGGKKADRPGYYLNLAPKEVFVAGGIWNPEAENLIKIRRHISENGKELLKILASPTFKRAFGSLSTDQVLKRPPKGFAAGHPYVELLKYKRFTVSHSLHPDEVLKEGFGKVAEKHFKLMKPLNEFLDQALTK